MEHLLASALAGKSGMLPPLSCRLQEGPWPLLVVPGAEAPPEVAKLSMLKTERVQPTSSSSRMRVINHNWSATKQRPHPQSVAEISRHSVLSGDRIRQCETSSESRHKDTDQCL